MKRNIYVLGAAALVMLAACQKEEVAKSNVALTATLEQQTDNGATKTALGESNTVVWSEGDKIEVHGSTGVEELTLTSGAGTTTGSFGTPTVESPDYAIYPSSAYTGISGSTITFTLPATQTYAAGSFGNGANVTVARIEGGNMAFKNVCGVLKLQLKGSMKVSRIELTGKNSEKLYGTFSVDAETAGTTGAVWVSDGGTTLTLDCGEGVQLSTTEATVFDFVVPVGSFGDNSNGGFTVRVYDVLGDMIVSELSTNDKANVINRSKIRRMPISLVKMELPEDYQLVEYLTSGNQTSHIVTDYYPTSFNSLQLRAKYQCPRTDNRVMGWAQMQPEIPSFHIGQASTIGHQVNFGLPSATNLAYAAEAEFPVEVECVNASDQKIFKFSANGNSKSMSFDLLATDVDLTGKYPISVFSRTIGENQYKVANTMKMYHFVVTQGSSLVMYLLPCYKKDGSVPGMYDIVTGKFYTNSGTGTFTCGSDVL